MRGLFWRHRAVLLGLLAGAIGSTPLCAQWTTGSGGAVYYNGGNVGIGTTTPIRQLHIFVQSSGGPLVDRAGATIWSGFNFFTAGTEKWFIGTPGGNDSLVFRNQGANNVLTLEDAAPANSLFIKSSGNVGIGTMTPQYRLAVNGVIGAKEVIVTSTGWSDYVFRPGYRLRPLREVASYIEANHHLPDIPSEAEVEKNGISMGQMQSKLLAKIEELTLHMIQQEKENEQLRQRIDRLEKGAQ